MASTCDKMVEGNIVSYACDLPRDHEGPCRAIENQRSVRERKRWDEEKRHAESGLAEFQGPALTTAQRYTEGATDVPGPQAKREPAEPARGSDGPSNPEVGQEQTHYYGDDCPGGHVAEFQAMVAEAEAATGLPEADGEVELPEGVVPVPVVVDQDTDGALRYRLASTAEAKVAGIGEPTKQRPGDQRLPQVRDDESVQDRIIAKLRLLVEREVMDVEAAEAIIAQMEQSKAVGVQRYGTPLQTFNGRDTLQDAVEEARDLLVYLNSVAQAREASRERLITEGQRALEAAVEAGGAPTAWEASRVIVDAILKATGGFEVAEATESS